jgi:hypothetical protein
MTARSVKRLEEGYRAMAADEEREAEAAEWAEALIGDVVNEAEGREKVARRPRALDARSRRQMP